MSNKFANKSLAELEAMKKALEPVVAALPQYAKDLKHINEAIEARTSGTPAVEAAKPKPCKKADLATTIAAQPKQEQSKIRVISF